MDHYDKTRSRLGNSVATPELGLVHSTGLEEHPGCESDIYLGYLQAPTREIINAIEGAGLTLDGTDLTQLSQAIASSGQRLTEVFSAPERAANGPSITPIVYTPSVTRANWKKISGKILINTRPTGSGNMDLVTYDYTFSQLANGTFIWVFSGSTFGSTSASNQVESNDGTGFTTALSSNLVTPSAPALNVNAALSNTQISVNVSFGATVDYSVVATAKVYT